MPCLLQLDWQTLLVGSEKWGFLFEIALRTLAMFVVIISALRLLGKRGVKQLSVLELGIIIGLGSSAGDPMFYKDVGLLPGFLVIFTVITLYRLVTFAINRSNRFERFMEGTPAAVLRDGCLLVEEFKREPIAVDELFSELRLRGVSHLGQVREAVIETNGEVSVFFLPDEEVRPGLPIIPRLCEHKLTVVTAEGEYACSNCGHTQTLLPAPEHRCPHCRKSEWLKAIDEKRIT